jgi:DNA invertase Pin-like site-specific DNA recombinase
MSLRGCVALGEYVIAKYIRLSIEDAKTDSMSIENQRLLLDGYIADIDMPGITVMEFVDNGHSGTNFERPAAQELLDLVRQGRVNCVAVKDLSRFGRNMIETGYYIERVFPLYRTRFIAISDSFDSDDYKGDTGGMDVAFKFLMHEYYSRDLSKKIKSAKHEKMRRGEHVRKDCLFGYRLDDKRQMVIDEPAADIVRLIFNLAIDGNSTANIAKRLYEEKLPTPNKYKGREKNSECIWTTFGINKILNDEQYIGTYIAGKRAVVEIGSRTAIRQPESMWYKIPGHHPAIIEKTLFEAVHKIIEQKSKPKCKRGSNKQQGRVDTDNPLKGKVVCGCCGHTMTFSGTQNAQYQCRFTFSAVDAGCHRMGISAKELAGTINDTIVKQAKAILGIDSLRDIGNLGLQKTKQSEVEKQIEICQDEKRRLYERLILGEIDAAGYKAIKTKIESEIDRLKSINTSLIAENEKLYSVKAINEKLFVAAKNASSEESLTSHLVNMLISKVSVFPGNRIEIAWKVSGFGG